MREEASSRQIYSRARDRAGAGASGQYTKAQGPNWGPAGSLAGEGSYKGTSEQSRWLSSNGAGVPSPAPKTRPESRSIHMKTAPGGVDTPRQGGVMHYSSQHMAGYSVGAHGAATASRQQRVKPGTSSLGAPMGPLLSTSMGEGLPWDSGPNNTSAYGDQGGRPVPRGNPNWAGGPAGASAYETDGRPGTRGGGTAYDLEGRPVTRGGTRPPSRMQLGLQRPSIDGMGNSYSSPPLPPGGQLAPLPATAVMPAAGLTFRSGAGAGAGGMDRPGSRMTSQTRTEQGGDGRGDLHSRGFQKDPWPAHGSGGGAPNGGSRASRSTSRQSPPRARKSKGGSGLDVIKDEPDIDAFVEALSDDDAEGKLSSSLNDMTNFLKASDQQEEAARKAAEQRREEEERRRLEEASRPPPPVEVPVKETNPKVMKMVLKIIDKCITEAVKESELNKVIAAAEAKEREEAGEAVVGQTGDDFSTLKSAPKLPNGYGPRDEVGSYSDPSMIRMPDDDFRHLSSAAPPGQARGGHAPAGRFGANTLQPGLSGMPPPATTSGGMSRYAQRRL
eukprot:gene18325-24787_t